MSRFAFHGSVLLAALLLSGARPLVAQSVAVDEGTFNVTVEGRSVGTETFSVRRVSIGSDPRVILQGQLSLELPGGALRMDPVLEATEGMSLAGYQNRISGSRDEVFSLEGTSDRRFQGRTVSGRGEQVQEYRAGSGTILIEDWVAHHFHLVGARVENVESTIPVIIPGEGRQLQLRITPEGTENITIGGTEIEARRYRTEVSGRVRDVWLDLRGRVLRVQDDARGYRAERTARPS